MQETLESENRHNGLLPSLTLLGFNWSYLMDSRRHLIEFLELNKHMLDSPVESNRKSERKMHVNKILPPVPENMLHNVNELMVDFPIRFRTMVCNECSWSIPTYYRKMRAIGTRRPPGKHNATIMSNAERDRIHKIIDDVFFNLWEEVNAVRGKTKDETLTKHNFNVFNRGNI